MNYFFLYTELAEYTMQCFRTHLEKHPEDEIHVVHYPVNAEAPFQFHGTDRLHLYNKKELTDDSLHLLADQLNPAVLFCSGWADREYNEIVSGLGKKQVPVVLCFDNLFTGTLKQRLFLPFARILFRSRYQAAWVPGERQMRFAKMLGFRQDRIFQGFYATDSAKYEGIFNRTIGSKKAEMPKRLLCVARYIPQKGLEFLWQAFAELSDSGATDWELWCAGTGEGFPYRLEHHRIRHLGFVQPADFENLIRDCAVFVLPSLFEPWGVVVNEFAASGMPLLLSDKIGSGDKFLQPGVNGYTFKPGSVNAVKEAILKITSTDNESLLQMMEASHRIGISVNSVTWSDTLNHLGHLNWVG